MKMFREKNIKKRRKVFLHTRGGFTLIEILVVIGIIAILSAVALIAINPSRQFKLARDSQRTSNVTAILNAIGQNMSENGGVFKCNGSALAIPQTVTAIKSTGGVDMATCLVPTYLSSLPFDPSASGAHYKDQTDYDTSYTVAQDPNNRITVSGTGEISPTISITR